MREPRLYTFGHIEIGARARALIADALDRDWISAGRHVEEFERAFAELFGVREAIAVSSGTSAVLCAVAALHDRAVPAGPVQFGDEIIVPALSFVATANAVIAAGLRPVFVDIRRETLNVDETRIEQAITPRTRAILVVHTMGRPCEMDAIQDIADRHGLAVLEDACEAHGARYRERPAGGLGLAGAFSFYAAHIVCTGEGGMVVTDDPEYAALLRSVRSHGRPDGTVYFQFDRYGLNAKMNDLEAAVGIEGVESFDSIFSTRRSHLAALLEGTEDLDGIFHRLVEDPHLVIAPHAFPLTVREGVPLDARKLAGRLEEHGVQVKTLFGSLPTQHRAFQRFGHRLGEFPEAEHVGDSGLHVGCHQYLERRDLDRFLELLHRLVREEL